MGEDITVGKFLELFEKRDSLAVEWKRGRGKKIVGCMSTYTPEEIIYAAGALPVEIIGVTSYAKADAYLPNFTCSIMRGFLEKLLQKGYGYLDLITLPALCDSIWGFYGIWKQISNNLDVYLLHYPSKSSTEAAEYFAKEVERFKDFIARFACKNISKKELRAAIDVYNENRRLLKKLYMLRKKESPPIFGSETLEIVLSSMVTPKALHNELLENLLRRIADRKEYPEGNVRVHVSGHLIEDPGLLRILEESGGLVVSDDLDTGSKYFWSLVDSGVNPIESVSERYVQLSSPYGSGVEKRIEYITAMIREFHAEGIVFLTRKFCDPYLFDYPMVEQAMKEEGVPSLHLEYEPPLAKGRLRTRVEAFMEMLR